MKKKLIVMFKFVVLFLFLFVNYSKGFVKDDFYHSAKKVLNISVIDVEIGATTKQILSDLKSKLGYSGDSLTEEMKIKTYIKITKVDENKNKEKNEYTIQFGESGKIIEYKKSIWSWSTKKTFTINELKETFGLDESVTNDNLKVGYTWNTNIIVRGEQWDDNHVVRYSVYLESLYAGADLNKIDEKETSNDNADSTVGDNAEKLTKFVDWFKEFCEHPVGKIVAMIMDFFTNYIGDNIQYAANLVQMIPDKTYKNKDILYSYNELKKDSDSSNGNEGAGNKDKYTKVGEYEEGEELVARVKVEVDKNENGEDDFSKETKIPVMIGDLYNIAVGHIDFLDVNFLTGNTTDKADGSGLRHDEDSIWTNFRNFAAAIIRISIYIASAILIMSLIWYGINIVRHTFDNPNARANSKEGLVRLKNAILILIGTIIFMSVCIFGSQAFYDSIEKEDSYELPIRVDVEGLYSFSTTPTGYVRYMSLTTDLEEALQKLVYSLSYLVLSIINFLAIVLMIGRMFILWILSMLGPIIAVFYVFGRQGPLSLRTWGGLYLSFSMVQVVITIIYKVILSIVV